MNRALILTAIFFLSVAMISCGGDDSSEKSGLGESCTKTSDCEDDLKCIDLVCVNEKNFPNEHDGLYWSDASNDNMTWYNAIEYCENIGGRLPTISELRTLIQNCPDTVTGGICGVTDECLSHENCWNDPCDGCEYDESGKYSVFGDTYWFWSSSEPSDITDVAWGAHFDDGDVRKYSKISSHYVRCVR